MGRFADDTAVTTTAPGRHTGRIDRGWWIQRGPNGGYIAAIVLRAMCAEVGDAGRRPRSFTLHYLRPPAEGPIELETTTERAGRSLSTVSARVFQDGKLLVLATAAFADDRPGSLAFDDTAMPSVPPPAECPPLGPPPFPTLTLRDRYECLVAIGGDLFSGGPDALTGGWIRLADGEAADDLAVAAFTDAWPPAVFTRTAERIAVPTIDLTVHFRQAVLDPGGWFLVVFRSVLSADGYVEEDGEVWSEGGHLVAQSRQLAVATFADA